MREWQSRNAAAIFPTAQPFAGADQRGAEECAQHDAHAGADPALLDRVTHQKYSAKGKREAADPHDPAGAKPLLEGRLGRTRRQYWGDRGRGSAFPGRWRRACSIASRDGRGCLLRRGRGGRACHSFCSCRSYRSAVKCFGSWRGRRPRFRGRGRLGRNLTAACTSAPGGFKRTQTGFKSPDSRTVPSHRLERSEACFDRAVASPKRHDAGDYEDRERQNDQRAERDQSFHSFPPDATAIAQHKERLRERNPTLISRSSTPLASARPFGRR